MMILSKEDSGKTRAELSKKILSVEKILSTEGADDDLAIYVAVEGLKYLVKELSIRRADEDDILDREDDDE